MITRKINNVLMELRAACYWGWWCDVAIIQKFHHPQRGLIESYIELSISDAEQLVAELQTAIAEAKAIDQEYRNSIG